MSAAELLKQLFLGVRRRDEAAVLAAARGLIQEVRNQGDEALARELEEMLRGVAPQPSPAPPPDQPSPPQDSQTKSALLDLSMPQRSLDDLILREETRSALDRLVAEFRGSDALARAGLAPLHRVLFCGPSGCGKTAAAEALANALGTPLVTVRFDAVLSTSLGRTVNNLRKVFAYAARERWVVLFEEFDAIGRSRDDPTEHGDHKRVVNACVKLLDDFRGQALLVAATDFEEGLDQALWQRFDEVIRFERPTVEQQRAFIRRQLQPLLHGEEQVVAIAHALGAGSFADAERVCLSIRKVCALRGEGQVTTEDIRQALKRYVSRRALQVRAGRSTPAVDKA